MGEPHATLDEGIPRAADGLPEACTFAPELYVERGDPIGVDDPATGEIIGWCRPTPVAAIDEVVALAERGFASWSALTPAARAEAMRAGAEAITGIPDLADVLVSEVGKTRHEAEGDINGGIHLVRSFADLAEDAVAIHDLTGKPATGQADEVLVHRVPVGPVAVITPWNSPVYLTMNCVAPALAAGCSVIVKPAEAAPLAVTAALVALAGALPAGALTVVQGAGARVGAALCEHPRIRGVLFVGGTTAGRRIIRAAAENIKKVSLELGGNDPAIVLEDADLSEGLLQELVAGCYSLSGQVCFNIKRIYVHRSRYDEFVGAFTRLVDQLVVGPGATPGVHLGPVTTQDGFENAQRLLDDARATGAHVHEGGVLDASADAAKGRYVRPSVVTDIAPDHELVLGEQFAPIIPILPFDTDDEAVREANRTEFGLCSSVWSADPDHARAVAMRVEAGNTFINAHRVGASVPLVPFGGFKQSGQGRNHMMHAIAECTEEHAVIRYTDASAQVRGIEPWQTLTLETRTA